jgi:VWFA-related protein
MRDRFTEASCSIVAALLLSVTSAGQPSQAGGATTQKDSAAGVNIFFSVGDGHGNVVPNLSKDSFQLREDGRPQIIQYLAAHPEQPLNVGILLDTSGLTQGALPAVKPAADGFLRHVMTEQDLAFVISFDITVDLLQDLTNDRRLLRAGIEQAKINVGSRSRGFHILLDDAIFLAADEILRKQYGRKALVIFTSGADQGSKVKIKDAIEAAQRADAVCYVLLIGRSAFASQVNDLAEQTGGRLVSVKDSDKLADALTEIATDLRNQYLLGYTPESGKSEGGFRTIEITSKEGYKVRARKGYYGSNNAN